VDHVRTLTNILPDELRADDANKHCVCSVGNSMRTKCEVSSLFLGVEQSTKICHLSLSLGVKRVGRDSRVGMAWQQ